MYWLNDWFEVSLFTLRSFNVFESMAWIKYEQLPENSRIFTRLILKQSSCGSTAHRVAWARNELLSQFRFDCMLARNYVAYKSIAMNPSHAWSLKVTATWYSIHSLQTTAEHDVTPARTFTQQASLLFCLLHNPATPLCVRTRSSLVSSAHIWPT